MATLYRDTKEYLFYGVLSPVTENDVMVLALSDTTTPSTHATTLDFGQCWQLTCAEETKAVS